MMWLFFGTLLVMSVVSCVLRVKTGNIMYMNYYRTIHSNILYLSYPLVCGVWKKWPIHIRRMGAVEQSTGFIICWNCHISFSKRSLTLHYRWLFVFLPLLFFLIWHLCFIRRALYFCLLVVDKSSSGKKYVEKGREMATITASQFFHLRRAP